MKTRAQFAVLLCLSFVIGTKALVIVDSIVASSCIYYMKQFDWGCNSTGNGASVYACRCRNDDWGASVSNCIYKMSTNLGQREHALEHVARRCRDKSKNSLTYTARDFTEFYEEANGKFKYPSKPMDIENELEGPIDVNGSDFKFYHDTFLNVKRHVDKTQWFGWALNIYWAFICVVAFLYTLTQRFTKIIPPLINNYIQAHFKDSSFLKSKYYSAPYYFADILPVTVLSRGELIAVAGFWILVIIFSIVEYDMMLPNAYMGDSKYFYLLDLISYRTCIMSFSLFPSMFFLGIRNSPIQLMTAWEKRTMVNFHKHIALAMAGLAFVHSCVWTAYTIEEGDYAMWAIDAYWQYGIVAMTLLALIIFMSLKWVRIYLYDIFLFIHNVFTILFIVTIYYHVSGMGWVGWIYSMIAIYCWDKAVRIFKILSCGSVVKRSQVLYDDHSLVKLSIPARSLLIKPKLGSYYYLYFLNLSLILYAWQSHPFSVYPDPEDPESYIALIKIKRGVTSKLYQNISRSRFSKTDLKIPIMMEGPYASISLSKIDYSSPKDLLLIAGGSGILSIYQYILEAESYKKKYDYLRIRTFWIVNDPSYFYAFSKELMNVKRLIESSQNEFHSRFEIIITSNAESFGRLYEQTRATNSSEDIEEENASVKEEKKSLKLNSGSVDLECSFTCREWLKLKALENSTHFKLTFLPCSSRPCLKSLVRSLKLKRDTTYVCCGPADLSDELRHEVNSIRRQMASPYNIELILEVF